MCSLVSLDMTNGNLETFEPPMVLNSLKILNLHRCTKLVSIRNLSRLPNLETLILRTCTSLSHVCETIGSLTSLSLLNLKGCKKLWKVSLKQKFVNHLERLNILSNGGGIREQPLFSLPQSLKFLFLDYCDIEYNSDIRMVFPGQSLFGLSLTDNPIEFLPNNIDFKMLRVLKLNYCANLKSILCLPSTLEELYTYDCKSLEKVTFQSARFRLRKFRYKGCFKLSEVEGFFKLVPIANLDEADLGHMKWIKAYQDHKVDLVCDEIIEGRIWHIQMLYEYGIRSTYLQGIKDQSMMTHEYMSSSNFLSFRLPLDLKACRIQGLNITTLYRLSGSRNRDCWCLFAKINNTTKGVTWIYNPVVHCKPKVDEDVVWLSYWPIGNIFDAGDEICVDIVLERGLVVSRCGASIVYLNDGELEQEEKWENIKKTEEVIGGDLSEFEVTTGVYYLCRCNFFWSKTSVYAWVKKLFDGTVHHTVLQGWRKSHQSLDASRMHLRSSMELNRDTLYKEIYLGYFNSESEICEIKNVVSRLEGVDFVDYLRDTNELFVSGNVDCMALEACVKELQKTLSILDVCYIRDRLLKHYHKKIVIWKNEKSSYKYRFIYMFPTKKKFL